MNMEIGKMLIVFGAVLVLAGALFMLAGLPDWQAGKMPGLGRLPGDIVIHKKNFTLFFPITTSILISLILSIIFYFFNRR
jgi:phosphotransferase system  glucose/maltose/N-acetylglucosamine-specific IIC component